MAFEEPWMPPEFSTASYSDAWSISEIFNSDETDTIARALQKTFTQDLFYSEIDGFLSAMMPKPTDSGESVAAVKTTRFGPAPSGRVAKRRYRPSKRALTTFISADPANFRRMVQQVTGTGFAAATAVKPYPNSSLAALPALDTSSSYSVEGVSVFVESPEMMKKAVKGGGSTAAKLNFDSFCNFPTLESWESDVDLEGRGKIGN